MLRGNEADSEDPSEEKKVNDADEDDMAEVEEDFDSLFE